MLKAEGGVMRTEKAKRAIMEVCHTEIRRYEGGFEWTFYGFSTKGKEIAFVMRFERWWLSYLAMDLRKVLNGEWEQLKRLTNLVGFKNE